MRRENRRLRHVLSDVGKRAAGLDHPQARILERGEGTVPLVEVKAAPVEAARTQSADAAHAQQQFLADAHALVAEVKACGQRAIFGAVAVDVGVEQKKLIAPNVHLPDLRQQAFVAEGNVDDERLAIGPHAQSGRQILDGSADVLRVLLPFPIDMLAKIGLAIEESHRDQSQTEIRRRLQVVAG